MKKYFLYELKKKSLDDSVFGGDLRFAVLDEPDLF